MTYRKGKRNWSWLVGLMLTGATALQAASIKGVVKDKASKEALIGATVQIVGTTNGTITDFDGNFEFPNLADGKYQLEVRYVSYETMIYTVEIKNDQDAVLELELSNDGEQLSEVTVVARKNLEGERMLLLERQKSTVAIENIGAKEMSIKGISNVEEGVKKISGISIASAGQLIVRGLGDRYSATTLNGLPIASPNPDNKLIPLDIFPASTVKNITVSKVYEADAFADYSGALIDISTKEQTGEDFVSLSFNTGGKFNTIGGDFYRMDRAGSLFKTPSIDPNALDMELSDFNDYVVNNNIFDTDFSVDKKTALPEFGGNIGFGKNFSLGVGTLSILASGGVSNDLQTMKNASIRTLEAGGNVLNEFNYDSYATELKIAGLANIGYSWGADHIGYTFFYARNAVDDYMLRKGRDYEDHQLVGSNNVTHIYTLMNHQLGGNHQFGEQWRLEWDGSYSQTSSEEPDRRQVMFEEMEDGSLELFKLNRQETMRYFGDLNENEWVGNVSGEYLFGDANKLQAGFSIKDKSRDYMSTRFYYNLNKLNPEVTSPYDTDGYLNQSNIENGTIVIDRKKLPSYSYDAGNRIYAGYVQADYYPTEALLINLGLRFESSRQWVNYYDDGGRAKRSELNKDDLFPAINAKYSLGSGKGDFRLSLSRTVTRPSFIEMAPFLYQESYGSAQIRGNADLQNGYNYNVDLRYELFRENSDDMLALTGYYKMLQDPIERVQSLSGGSAVHSFRNAADGLATGLEIELRKQIIRDLKVSMNASFMYTNVKLPDGGAYTNSQRALQGASPYLINADVTYSPCFSDTRMLNLALLYNLQGPRIHAVGISGLGDVKQQPVHTLDFVAGYQVNERFNLKLQMKDILNRDVVFVQDVPNANTKMEVERFKRGAGFEIGASYNF